MKLKRVMVPIETSHFETMVVCAGKVNCCEVKIDQIWVEESPSFPSWCAGDMKPVNCPDQYHPANITVSCPEFPGPEKPDPFFLQAIGDGKYIVRHRDILWEAESFFYDPVERGKCHDIVVESYQVVHANLRPGPPTPYCC